MILETLKETAMVQEAAQAEKALHKFSFKKLMDYRIESKKTITP